MYNENEKWIAYVLGMDTNILDIKSASVCWCLHLLSNTHAIFEAQFMRKLGNPEGKLL